MIAGRRCFKGSFSNSVAQIIRFLVFLKNHVRVRIIITQLFGRLNTLVRFAALFYILCEFPLILWSPNYCQKGFILKEANSLLSEQTPFKNSFAPYGINFFPFRVEPFLDGRQKDFGSYLPWKCSIPLSLMHWLIKVLRLIIHHLLNIVTLRGVMIPSVVWCSTIVRLKVTNLFHVSPFC